MANEIVKRGVVARMLSAFPRTLDGGQSSPAGERIGATGESYVLSPFVTKHLLNDEGAYFTASNPTLGTGIQLAANVTAFADTNAIFVIQNNDAPGGKRIHLDFLRLFLTGTAPTATTNMEFAVKTDAINRFPTTAANLTALASVSCNQDSGIASIAKVVSYANAGAMTIPASSAQTSRLAARARIATGLGITGDVYTVQFGGVDHVGRQPLTAVRATDPAAIVAQAQPVAIGPGQSAAIHMWWLTAATTAATFEFDLSWFER